MNKAHVAETPATGHAERELLEFAAKAAGIEGHWVGGDCNSFIRTYNGYQMGWWNPRDDDGDALRLAVKLLITVTFGANYVIVGGNQVPLVNNASDPYTATRRAIVRAAAEIGKAMP